MTATNNSITLKKLPGPSMYISNQNGHHFPQYSQLNELSQNEFDLSARVSPRKDVDGRNPSLPDPIALNQLNTSQLNTSQPSINQLNMSQQNVSAPNAFSVHQSVDNVLGQDEESPQPESP